MVDTSASRELDLSLALSAGCKVVYANKNALSAPWAMAASLYGKSEVAYEATVGAGLPVIQTLRSLVATGDTITRIEGVMSGHWDIYAAVWKAVSVTVRPFSRLLIRIYRTGSARRSERF